MRFQSLLPNQPRYTSLVSSRPIPSNTHTTTVSHGRQSVSLSKHGLRLYWTPLSSSTIAASIDPSPSHTTHTQGPRPRVSPLSQPPIDKPSSPFHHILSYFSQIIQLQSVESRQMQCNTSNEPLRSTDCHSFPLSALPFSPIRPILGIPPVPSSTGLIYALCTKTKAMVVSERTSPSPFPLCLLMQSPPFCMPRPLHQPAVMHTLPPIAHVDLFFSSTGGGG